MMQLGTGNYAVANMEKAVELSPEDTLMVIDVANTLHTMSKPEKVIAVTKQGLLKAPSNVDLLTYQGLSLERLNRLDESRAVLNQALETANEDAAIVPELARVLRRLKEYEEAEKLLLATKAGFEGAPLLLGRLWNELGHVYNETGRFDKAFPAFEEYGKASLSSDRAQSLDEEQRDKQIDINQKWITGGGLTRVSRYPEKEGKTLAFLVGFPRSGTTLTEQVMAAHSRIVTSEEQPICGRRPNRY